MAQLGGHRDGEPAALRDSALGGGTQRARLRCRGARRAGQGRRVGSLLHRGRRHRRDPREPRRPHRDRIRHPRRTGGRPRHRPRRHAAARPERATLAPWPGDDQPGRHRRAVRRRCAVHRNPRHRRAFRRSRHSGPRPAGGAGGRLGGRLLPHRQPRTVRGGTAGTRRRGHHLEGHDPVRAALRDARRREARVVGRHPRPARPRPHHDRPLRVLLVSPHPPRADETQHPATR